MNKKTKKLFSTLISILTIGLGVGLVLAGAIVISLKLFGIPLLFEGIVSLVLGLLCLSLGQLVILFNEITDIAKVTADQVTVSVSKAMAHVESLSAESKSKPKKDEQFRPMPPEKNNFNSGVMNNGVEMIQFDEMTEAQLDNLKSRFPHLVPLLESILYDKAVNELNLEDINSNNEGKFAHAGFFETFAHLSEAQLRKELEKAIEKDDFEKAVEIQKEIRKKTSND